MQTRITGQPKYNDQVSRAEIKKKYIPRREEFNNKGTKYF